MTTRRQPVWNAAEKGVWNFCLHPPAADRPLFWMRCLAAALLVCVGLAGCNTLKFTPLSPEKLVRTDKEQAPLPPGKCALRVSQFVFLSDFELQRDAPLFQELAQL